MKRQLEAEGFEAGIRVLVKLLEGQGEWHYPGDNTLQVMPSGVLAAMLQVEAHRP